MRKPICALIAVILVTSAAYGQENQPKPAIEETVQNAGIPVKSPNDLISLNLKGMDILDVIKMFTPYGLNIVVGKNVSGKVTIFLKNVKAWDAFEIILLACDLAYEKKGSIITITTQKDYEELYGRRSDDLRKVKVLQPKYAKAADLAQTLNQVKSNAGKVIVDQGSNILILVDIPERLADMEALIAKTDLPLKTIVFDLNFAQAEKIQSKIQDILSKNVGAIRIDERTNKIVVSDYPEKIEEISRIISAFDEKTKQVLIDAQIVEISPSKTFKMGVDWDFWLKKNVRLVSSLPTTGAVNKLSIGTAASGSTPDSEGNYKGIIDLLQTIGDLKILSSPRIMALNSQEARLLVGTKQPYAQSTTVTGTGGSVTTSESVNYVDVGIKLYVTPTINSEGFISMRIKPEVSSLGTPLVTAQGEQIPVVSTSEAETAVMVKDGVTVIIGGLTKHQSDRQSSRIPVLGSIPLLGAFFGRTSFSNQKNELVILLTPHIIAGDTTFSDFDQVRPKDGTRLKIEGDSLVAGKSAMPSSPSGEGTLDAYYSSVLNKVADTASRYRSGKTKGKATVFFRVLPDGTLAEEPFVDSAAGPALIPLTIKAVKAASPFPAFPNSVKKERLTFKAELSF